MVFGFEPFLLKVEVQESQEEPDERGGETAPRRRVEPLERRHPSVSGAVVSDMEIRINHSNIGTTTAGLWLPNSQRAIARCLFKR